VSKICYIIYRSRGGGENEPPTQKTKTKKRSWKMKTSKYSMVALINKGLSEEECVYEYARMHAVNKITMGWAKRTYDMAVASLEAIIGE
jgi:hypothetical protein